MAFGQGPFPAFSFYEENFFVGAYTDASIDLSVSGYIA
jgi:hypothetical protein